MTERLFDTVLVANRGEIARRVIRTLRRLGIRAVAVYSDADADAPHVREADTAVRIGPAPASRSYLDIGAVVGAAVASGAQAVHPGYGFLSENAAFARACSAAGLVFVGPGVGALEVMGDKIRAKEHVAAHAVPVVPGFSAAGMSDAAIAAAADDAGFPLLVKPSAGGGGKGMQVVRDAAGLAHALATARRVAAASFGDDTLMLERLIDRPRHIEVQVLADARGGIVHLGERECTLQRRHQKVIEEAPSPAVSEEARERLGSAACAAARSVDYVGAGTVEFLVSADDPGAFFFIEMNTRLQVEHPVTELVTGVDLVEQQLRCAAGRALTLRQEDVRLDGHAVEARVYAESPARGFLPATGEVLAWSAPHGDGVRVDAGVDAGSSVTADYDPMIAKVIAHASDRAGALDRLDAALSQTVLLGLDTNIGFLRELIADPRVRAGRLETGLIDGLGLPEPAVADEEALSAAAWASSRHAPQRPDPWSQVAAGWRVGAPGRPIVRSLLGDAGEMYETTEPSRPPQRPAARDAAGAVWAATAHGAVRLRPLTRRESFERRHAGRRRASAASDPDVRAPMPGAVVAVHVADGDSVRAGDRLISVEAMKMEHPVTAPHDGIVQLAVARGDQVGRDQIIATVSAEQHPGSPVPTADS